ncbi:hypothetical protein ACPCVO_39245 [Streptomyces umbrinus]|uniref:hypothetical protein n=1 Tax=Streptomyces umbrinus TaxID=67370 RepID=UPI003C2CE31A
MTSVLLEEREAAARVRVDGLREEAARLAEGLEAAEIELDRRVIAREELVEALAVSAAGTIAVTEVQETVCSPVPGSTVPPWRDGLPVTVLAPDCRRILRLLVVHRPCVSDQRRCGIRRLDGGRWPWPVYGPKLGLRRGWRRVSSGRARHDGRLIR